MNDRKHSKVSSAQRNELRGSISPPLLTAILVASVSSFGCGGNDFVYRQPAINSDGGTVQIDPMAFGIGEVVPGSAVAGSGDLTIRILGRNLSTRGDLVKVAVWSVGIKRTKLATSFVSDTEITAVLPASLLGSPVSATLSLEQYDMDDNLKGRSNGVRFDVAPEQ